MASSSTVPPVPPLHHTTSSTSSSTSSSSGFSTASYCHPFRAIRPPAFQGELVGNEAKCKELLALMVEEAYRFQNSTEGHTDRTMEIEFDSKGNIVRTYPNEYRNLQYLPPEMLDQPQWTPCADVWVLGIALYRMLVGEYPFKANNSASDRDLFSKMQRGNFKIPESLTEGVKILLRLMLAPAGRRASLDLVGHHDWLKPHRPAAIAYSHSLSRMSSTRSTHPRSTHPEPSRKSKKKKRFLPLLILIINILFFGPYPPPRHYRKSFSKRR